MKPWLRIPPLSLAEGETLPDFVDSNTQTT